MATTKRVVKPKTTKRKTAKSKPRVKKSGNLTLAEKQAKLKNIKLLVKKQLGNEKTIGVRKIHYDGRIIYEYKPQTRTIRFGNFKRVRLAFPYMQFSFNGSQLKVTCTNSPLKIKSHGTYAYYVCLPNIGYSDGMVCLGNRSPANIESAITMFWNTSFDPVPEYYSEDFCGMRFSQWERKTEKTILETKWNSRIYWSY